MAKKNLIILVACVVCFCTPAFTQGTLNAKVIEVIDARTLVLETAAGRITAQLQYLEIPEPDQPLNKVVRDHLAKLTVGRGVEFRTERIMAGNAIGRMTMDGVDLSAQMIRDGAAWHEPASMSGQNPIEAAEYAENQRLAQAEKRGVWSMPNLKAPWEVRSERNALVHQDEAARRIARPTRVGVSEFQSDIRRPSGNHLPTKAMSARQQMDAWVGLFANSQSEGYGIHTYNDPQGRFGVVYTSPVLLDFVSKSGAREKLECRGVYVTMNGSLRKNDGVYFIGFRAIADDYRFSRTKPRLTVIADGRNLSLGTPMGYRSRGSIGSEEIIFYRTSWATMKKLGAVKNLNMRIGQMNSPVADNYRALFDRLAIATQ